MTSFNVGDTVNTELGTGVVLEQKIIEGKVTGRHLVYYNHLDNPILAKMQEDQGASMSGITGSTMFSRPDGSHS